MTDDLKRSMESDAQKDKGAAYHGRINFSKMEKMDVIELFLTKSPTPKTG